MSIKFIVTGAFALSAIAAVSASAGTPPHPKVGDRWIITSSQTSAETGNDDSSSSSQDNDVIAERVIAVRADGVELVYDLPQDTGARERAATWQLPVRVFKPLNGPIQLLNEAELESRVDGWLKKAKWTRAACGKVGFTWTAFRVECDPKSALLIVDHFALPDTLAVGDMVTDPKSRTPLPLARGANEKGEPSLAAQLMIDPDQIRRDRAQTQVAVAEITGKPISLDSALVAEQLVKPSGTITLSYDLDSSERVWRRTKVTRIRIAGPGNRITNEITTQVIERSPGN